MSYKMIHACVSCVLLLSASAGVAAASGSAACPVGGFQLSGGACVKCPDGMVTTVWPDRTGIDCDYRQARPPISSPLANVVWQYDDLLS